MEGSGEGIGCVLCMLMCIECVGCNVVATEHGRYSLSCMQKLSSDGSYGMLGV